MSCDEEKESALSLPCFKVSPSPLWSLSFKNFLSKKNPSIAAAFCSIFFKFIWVIIDAKIWHLQYCHQRSASVFFAWNHQLIERSPADSRSPNAEGKAAVIRCEKACQKWRITFHAENVTCVDSLSATATTAAAAAIISEVSNGESWETA